MEKQEIKTFILGKIAGLNEARTFVWGIGFDNDKTADYIKSCVWKSIKQLQEIIDIDDVAKEIENLFISLKPSPTKGKE